MYTQARDQQAILLTHLAYEDRKRLHVCVQRAIRWERNIRNVAKALDIEIQYTGWLDYYATKTQLEVIQ